MTSFQKIKKPIISLFILLNLFTFLFYLCPQRIKKYINKSYSSVSKLPNKRFPPFWVLNKYSQFTGLNNRWGMFTTPDSRNWWLTVKAKYKNNKIITLPLPKQSKRTFIEKFVFDFRETQYRARIYNEKSRQKRYAYFLCRNFSSYEKSPVESIIFERQEQKVLELKEASKRGYYLEPIVKEAGVNIFQCPLAKVNK